MKSFRDIVQEAEISYEDWKKVSAELNAEVDAADAEINKVAGDTKGGLVPDEVQKSKEYKNANKNYNNVFKKLQAFNKNSPKKHMNQHGKEMRANRGRK